MKSSTPAVQVAETLHHIDSTVVVQGWVHTIRDMGKIAFIEVRDHTGLLQVVVDDPSTLPKLGPEYVVSIRGAVRKRGERYINPRLVTGTVELGAESVEVLNDSQELPFEVKKDTLDVNEELRLKHRYLDLRSERMVANLKLRHQVNSILRNHLDEQSFTEVETPLLTKGTPEGAREFLVPARLHPDQFYVLPQSPQQFKQMLMVGGIGRYYQIVRCLRDEDQRGDRQPEFTQLDVEMSFVDQEDILRLNEKLLIKVVQQTVPDAQITTVPFPRLTYAEAMEQHGTDKPDLRKDKNNPKEFAFCWVTDFPLFEIATEGSKLDAVHHPFTAPNPEDMPLLDSEPDKVRALAYDIALNGFEVGGGSIRIHDAKLQAKVFELLGLGRQEAEQRFGHILEAFKYGTPPHGGIAWGLDRLLMLLAGEPNIREVIAFPKTGDARDPLTGAPTTMPTERLDEVGIALKPKKPNKRAGS
ncbi:aspartate--tRNA ligase [Patescibacteria group bacterium]|nr:MAG: aspartate--tRNA ligase [Patescibacteria group bacterium]